MREMVISVTQAARQFADCVNRVRYQGASFVLHKNGVPVARLVPVKSTPDAPTEPPAATLHNAQNEALQDEQETATVLSAHEQHTAENAQPSGLPKRTVLNW